MSARFRPLVEAGAAILDAHFGDRQTWAQRVCVETLDMWDPNQCILGHVFDPEGDLGNLSGFTLGCDELELSIWQERTCGFGFPDHIVGPYPNNARAVWHELRDTWGELLAKGHCRVSG